MLLVNNSFLLLLVRHLLLVAMLLVTNSFLLLLVRHLLLVAMHLLLVAIQVRVFSCPSLTNFASLFFLGQWMLEDA